MSKEAKFEKAAFGYRPEEVDRYIEELEKKLASAKSEKTELLGKMKILADKITEYRSDEGNLKEAMLGAQRMKSSIESEAKAKADEIVSEARERSEQLISDAQTKSSQMITDAQERSEALLSEAQRSADAKVNSVTSQVEHERATLSQLQKEVSSFKNKLISLYREHLNLITNLPEKAPSFTDTPAASAKAEVSAQKAPEAAKKEEYTFNADAFADKFGEVKLS